MDKKLEKSMKKIEEVMASYRVDKMYQSPYSSDSKEKFKLSDRDTKILISKNLYQSSNVIDVSDEEIIELAKNYLENGGKTLNIMLEGKVRQRSLVNFLFKENLSDIHRERFMDMTLNHSNIYSCVTTIDYISQFFKKHPDKEDLSKKMLANIFKQINVLKPEIDRNSWLPSKDFERIADVMECFKFKTEDYPLLHSLFTAFESPIKNDYTGINKFIDFLKKHIPPSDWDEFKKYSKEERKTEKPKSIFSSNENPKLHLAISEELIAEIHPCVSFEKDFFTMMNTIVRQIKKNKEEMGLQDCFIVSTENKITQLYFISKDEKPIKEQSIKEILTFCIDGYAEEITNKKFVSDSFVETTLRAAVLSSQLNESKNETKVFKNNNKI